MGKQVQRQAARSGQQGAQEQQEAAADLRDERLDEDVECCLADIDCCLAEAAVEAEPERDQALREFSEIQGRYVHDETELRVWRAKYAHLGLGYDISCCVPVAYDAEGNEYL